MKKRFTDFEMGGPRLLGRVATGTGGVQEIKLGGGLSFEGSFLVATATYTDRLAALDALDGTGILEKTGDDTYRLVSPTHYLTRDRAGGLYAPLTHTHANATQSTSGFMSSKDKTKLDNITTSDTPDDYLLARENHTGSQPHSTITMAKGLLGRTAGTGPSEVLPIDTIVQLLPTFGATKGLVPVSTGTGYLRADGEWVTSLEADDLTLTGALSAQNFSGNSSGTNTGDQTIELTGAVSGSGTGSFVTTLSEAAVATQNLAPIPQGVIGSAAGDSVEVLDFLSLKGLLDLSGTNTGDQTITLTGDVEGSGTGSFPVSIAANAVTLNRMERIPRATILGNNSLIAANVKALTMTDLAAMLPAFTDGLGIVAANPAPEGAFLCDDGTWSHPQGLHVSWGDIEGSLVDQADLVSMLSTLAHMNGDASFNEVEAAVISTNGLTIGSVNLSALDGGIDAAGFSVNGDAVALSKDFLKGATATLSFREIGSPTLIGNSAHSLSETHFSSAIITEQSAKSAAKASLRYEDAGTFAFGFTQGGDVDGGIGDIEHGLYVEGQQVKIILDGTIGRLLGEVREGDILAIEHDGVSIVATRNGEAFYSSRAKANKQWFLKVSLGTGHVGTIAFDQLRSVQPNGLYNGSFDHGVRGWRNTSSTYGTTLTEGTEGANGRASAVLARTGEGEMKMTSRAFPINGGEAYGFRIRSKGAEATGGLRLRIRTSTEIDDYGYLAGSVSSGESSLIDISDDWIVRDGVIFTEQGHRYADVEIITDIDAPTSVSLDGVTITEGAPFISVGPTSPAPRATMGSNLMRNPLFDEGEDGLFGYSSSKALVIVNLDGASALTASEPAVVFCNHTSEERMALSGPHYSFSAHVEGTVEFHIEAYDGDGLPLGSTGSVFSTSSAQMRSAHLELPNNAVTARLYLKLSSGAKVSRPVLRDSQQGFTSFVSDRDILSLSGTEASSQALVARAAGDSIDFIQNDALVQRFDGGRVSIPKLVAENISAGDLKVEAGSVSIESDATLDGVLTVTNKLLLGAAEGVIDMRGKTIGAQEDSLYLRTDDMFSVFKGGVHSETDGSAGGGKVIFQASETDVTHNGRSIVPVNNVTGFRAGHLEKNDVVWGGVVANNYTINGAKSLVRARIAPTRSITLKIWRQSGVKEIEIGTIKFIKGGVLGEVTIKYGEVQTGDLIMVTSEDYICNVISDIAFLLRE